MPFIPGAGAEIPPPPDPLECIAICEPAICDMTIAAISWLDGVRPHVSRQYSANADQQLGSSALNFEKSNGVGGCVGACTARGAGAGAGAT